MNAHVDAYHERLRLLWIEKRNRDFIATMRRRSGRR